MPSECPQEVADIISACMQRDVKARPSAREICRCALCTLHTRQREAETCIGRCAAACLEPSSVPGACRQLYSAEPVWEEPEDLRTMLDESTFEVTEEMVRVLVKLRLMMLAD